MNSSVVSTDLDESPNIILGGGGAVSPSSNAEVPQQQNIFDKLRGADIDLLKILDVHSIVNLMVEKRRTIFGVK